MSEPRVTTETLTANSLTEQQLNSCKENLENLVSGVEEIFNHDTSQVPVIDLTDWIIKQFIVARNSIDLHGFLISKSGFFEYFPDFNNEESVADCLTRNTYTTKGFETTLVTANKAKIKVNVKIDMEKLQSAGDSNHRAANMRITKGSQINPKLQMDRVIATLLDSFHKAIQIAG